MAEESSPRSNADAHPYEGYALRPLLRVMEQKLGASIMDQQAAAMERIGRYVAERYPMYVTNAGFEQWLYAKAGLEREMIDRYLELLEDYGIISGDGRITEDYRTLPDPERVRDDIERRIAALSPEALALLSTASVEGDRFSTEILAEVHGSGKDIDRLLQKAVDAGVIVPESNISMIPALSHRYRFVPLQTRKVLYERLPDGERTRLHSRLVELLSAQVAKVSDPGAQDMLHRLISEHNKVFARPDPPPSKV